VVAVLLVGIAALLAIPASGFVKRHSDLGEGVPALVGRRLEADPAYRNGSAPVATTPAYIGPLAGDRLSHPLASIPRNESCPGLARRGERQWLVIYGGPFGGGALPKLRRCLSHPLLDLPAIVLYRPPRQ
jgi:hypothetical protein